MPGHVDVSRVLVDHSSRTSPQNWLRFAWSHRYVRACVSVGVGVGVGKGSSACMHGCASVCGSVLVCEYVDVFMCVYLCFGFSYRC